MKTQFRKSPLKIKVESRFFYPKLIKFIRIAGLKNATIRIRFSGFKMEVDFQS